MAAVPREAVGVGSGPYFTKYSEDHWTTAETPAQSAVMFKDKEYPSASAALEAYIQQYEKRPGRGLITLGCTPIRAAEPVEELLIPQVSGNQLQAQRLRALRNMVDEAYERLANKGPHRGPLPGTKEHADLVNSTLTESQRLLTQITADHLTPPAGPTPSATTGSTATDVLLNMKPLNYVASGIPASTNTKKRSFKTMQDYVDEARQAGIIQSPSSGTALSQLQSSLAQMRSQSDPARARVEHEHLGRVIGSTAKPTVLTVPTSSRVYSSGGRNPPSWIEDLGATPVSTTNGHHRQQNGAHKSVSYADELMRSNSHLSVRDLRLTHSEGLSDIRSKDDIFLLRDGGRGKKAGAANSDFVSLTTDDLVYASPDGRSLSGMKLAYSLSSPNAGKHQSTRTSDNNTLTQHPSPTSQRIRREGLPVQGKVNSARQEEAGSNTLLSSMRRDFAARLLQEVEESHSSIITGHLGEGRALHPYESPVLHHRAPNQPTKSPPHYSPSPTRLRTLGLLTPETERLLSNPPMPGPMPGYAPSPTLPHFSSESSESPKSQTDETLADQNADNTEDFTERVRALLLAPPAGGETSTSPGGSQQTDEILDGDREWERQPPYKPLKYISEDLSYGTRLDSSNEKKANIVDSFLKECLDETDKDLSHRLTGPAQPPGSMEALKNMLFKVQGMVPAPGDQSVNQDEAESSSGDERNQEELQPPGGEKENLTAKEVRFDDGTLRPASGLDLLGLESGAELAAGVLHQQVEVEGPLTASQKSLAAYQHLVSTSDSFDDQKGTESLQKALEHLSRLKTLVKETK